ncbi:signal transduction histidine kinase [Cryobacterium sp. CAN_C3]|uniref:HAMP domain-containing sensor histidine kinase n=1 Tax=unclassified Cryobacterium TaxID=2649013 RepID=UPI0018CB2B1C|nr:HAMP domain-containing sensor histidine kinase [Cryobacterium sp. CAN_C3]MEC5155429.1 signal transduction histidine kinase [Cryobacterium sp. CAN_C3]
MTRRIMAIALISSLIAFALFLVPLAIVVYNLFLADAHASLERNALHAAVVVDPTFSKADRTELPTPASGQQLGLYDRAGMLSLGTGPSAADEGVRDALDGRFTETNTDGWLVAVVPISSAEVVTGAVRSAMPIEQVWARTRLVWLILLGTAGIALAGGILVARSLARRITRPMEKLTLASHLLGEGNFDVRTFPTGLPEIDRAGAALNLTAVRLGELVRRERELASNASHQLRTPLTGLRMVLETGLATPHADARAVLAQAIERADQLELTIDELITLNRGESNAAPVDASEQLDNAARRWKGPLAAAGRPLRVETERELPRPIVDAAALQQILGILIENALRHGAGAVTLRARAAHGVLAIDVEDEGSHLVSGDEIFLTRHSADGGSGLGLTLARQLAGDQGGRLFVSARKPHTRFTLLLNVDDPDGPFSVA